MKTDEQLKIDVVSELNCEPSVNSVGIGVEVESGVVTLAGHVDSYAEKLSAEQAAERVSGVRALAVEIDVRLPDPNERRDTDIALAARHALDWSTYSPTSKIQITVEQGCVTLSGEVEWAFQRQAASNAVHFLMGVTGVSDNIVLKSAVSAVGVKADIEAALKRRSTVHAKNIFVEVNGSDGVLSGTTNTWSERLLASDSAKTTAGVHHVVNNILVMWAQMITFRTMPARSRANSISNRARCRVLAVTQATSLQQTVDAVGVMSMHSATSRVRRASALSESFSWETPSC